MPVPARFSGALIVLAMALVSLSVSACAPSAHADEGHTFGTVTRRQSAGIKQLAELVVQDDESSPDQ